MSITHLLRIFPDIVNEESIRQARELHGDTELHQLIKCVAVSVIEPDEHSFDTLFVQGISEYYDRVAKSIMEDDEFLIAFLGVIKILRQRFTSFMEYSKFINTVSPTKETPEHDDVCCCCHESLDSWRRVVRLKAASGDPGVCGHYIHHTCAKRLKANEEGTFVCPMCREGLGTSVSFWYDVADTPKY